MLTELRIDDLDGEKAQIPADDTIPFSVDGKDYSIDLTNKHAREMREALKPFIRAGAKLGPVPRGAAGARRRGARRRRDNWLAD